MAAVTLIPSQAWARIKLITLPVRQRVEIQLDHPSVTLVEEQRVVPLVKGRNQVDFSWANTRIDPQTLVFAVLPAGDGAVKQVNVLSVSYPPGENALVWDVAADASGSALVRISYVLGGLTKSFSYRALADRDEKNLELQQYILVQNLANEQYDTSELYAGFGAHFIKPIGLNQTRQILVEKFPRVPVRKTYTCDLATFGWLDASQQKLNVPMHYVIKNDKASGLGAAPLPYGKARIFQDDGKGTPAFLGEDWGRFTPRDDEMRLYLGLAKDVSVKRTVADTQRIRVAGNLTELHAVVKYEIENFKDAPAGLDIVESLPRLRDELWGDNGREVQWDLGERTSLGKPDAERTTLEKVQFHVDLPARAADGKAEKIVHHLHVIYRNEWR
jgi:hypothetical protein